MVKFQLDSTTGVLQTGPAGFDYEDSTDRMYTIVMVAQDGGTPAQYVRLPITREGDCTII